MEPYALKEEVQRGHSNHVISVNLTFCTSSGLAPLVSRKSLILFKSFSRSILVFSEAVLACNASS